MLREANTDHASIAGLEVLQFEAYKQQLDSLTATPGSKFKGFSPRWTVPVRLRNSLTGVNTSCLLIVIDSAREIGKGIGPSFSQRPLRNAEIMVGKHAVDFLKLRSGEEIEVRVEWNTHPMLQDFVSHQFKIIETFESGDGKFGDSLGNVALIDCNYIDDYFAYNLVGQLAPEARSKLRLGDVEINFCNYA